MAGKQQPGRTVKSFEELVNDCLDEVEELFPWDLEELLQNDPGILILDIREPYEFDAMHIRNSVNVPRGVLESACEYDYEETVPELVEAREREGERLGALIEQRLTAMREQVTQARERMPLVIDGVRQRLRSRLAEVLESPDPERLEQEMALLAQRLDVDEEMDRLSTHLNEVARVLREDEPVGRRLDFLMQEFNREANTLGSKSADSETTSVSVELKVLIEQMREQVQNVE